jgi:hypothetical protein
MTEVNHTAFRDVDERRLMKLNRAPRRITDEQTVKRVNVSTVEVLAERPKDAISLAKAKKNALKTVTQNPATAILQQPVRVFAALALLNILEVEMNVTMIVNRSCCKPIQH